MAPIYFLLVDDLAENLLSLEALLRRDGLVLLKARSGEEALELLLVHDVALALLDVQMPGMDGFELAELMRGNDRTRRVPIIFVTAGSADSQRKFRGYETGAVDFIQKPIETDILRSKTNVFFELHRQQQQIAAQRDELEASAEALRHADRNKDQFLAVLAHELRNPLTPLRMGIDVLSGCPDPERAAQVRDMMDRQLNHLVRLVDDLLDVSRVSQGKITLQKAEVAASEVVQSAVELCRPLIDAGSHTLNVTLPSYPISIKADKTRIAQVIGNLLNNAAKYTPQNGVIALDVYREHDELVIVVSDNGIGIPAEMQSQIFQMFTQVEGHVHRAKGGLGIGLALVKQLVLMHEGSISVQSDGIDRGATFTVRLPAMPEEVRHAPSSDPHGENEPGRRLRILVVDDNADVAETVGWLLEDMGHDFLLVHDSRSALEAGREFRPDAVLLDIGMPYMDGHAVCRLFRQDDVLKDTVIVAQTGWGQETDRAATTDAGFDCHLVKPVGLPELKRVLDLVINEKA
ncbi:response regulator [Dyella jejuensis]|uniref:histidine kinase n=1 Tax=Dyella jejuensis TaxID=1432009 RepID=A0ABW8JK49_9GAMM